MPSGPRNLLPPVSITIHVHGDFVSGDRNRIGSHRRPLRRLILDWLRSWLTAR
jgi:hypothetical protein